MTEKKDSPPNYAFYGEGMASGFFGVGVRRVLRRLQRPWLIRQVQIFDELRRAIDAQEAQLAEIRRLIAELRTEVQQQEARTWDQTAIARRLAAIEDALPESTALHDRQSGTAEEATRY